MSRPYRPRRPVRRPPKSPEEIDEIVRKMKSDGKKASDYRRKSLAIHGWICAKCGREFTEDTLHQLTVHHRDGNHNNNPPDGSNWENLCIYCHDDEHSRSLLGDYLSGEDKDD